MSDLNFERITKQWTMGHESEIQLQRALRESKRMGLEVAATQTNYIVGLRES